MSFAQQIRGFGDNTKSHLQSIRKGVTIKLFNAVILDSPVDTGRFRANWQLTTVNPAAGKLDEFDKTGINAIQKMTEGVLRSGGDEPIFLTNNLPYAERLEHGWSKQQPEGMVRKNIVRFNQLVRIQASKENIGTQ